MSLSSKLRILTAGAALATLPVQAQTEQQSEPKSPAITQTVTNDFPWERSSSDAREAYATLPAEYKAFANKSFMERVEMREEWEQRDYIKRNKAHQQQLKTHPESTPKYPVAEGDFGMQIIKDRYTGKLTPTQAALAHDLMTLGRPLTSIDLSKPYSEQLRDCGFTTLASVVEGTKEQDLSARDHALYIWQIQEADQLTDLGNNREAWRETRIRTEKEDQAHYEANSHWYDVFFRTKTRYLTEEEMAKHSVQWENINGKSVIVPVKNQISYSVRDEVTRKVGAKIAQENQLLTKKAKANQATH